MPPDLGAGWLGGKPPYWYTGRAQLLAMPRAIPITLSTEIEPTGKPHNPIEGRKPCSPADADAQAQAKLSPGSAGG